MTLEEFNAGEYIKVDDYKSFIPNKLIYDWVWNDSELNKLLAEANLQLGTLNGFAEQIPNIDIYILKCMLKLKQINQVE